MSTRTPLGKCKPRPRTPPASCHPLVRQFLALMVKRAAGVTAVAERSGLTHSTVRRWYCTSNPRIDTFEAALNVLGYRLAIVRVQKSRVEPVKPAELLPISSLSTGALSQQNASGTARFRAAQSKVSAA